MAVACVAEVEGKIGEIDVRVAEAVECQSQPELVTVARQRLPRLRLQFDFGGIAKCKAAKAIPFWRILPLRPARNVIHRVGFHGRKGRTNGENHEF